MSSVLFWTVNTAHHSQFIQQGVSSTPHRQTTHIEGSITNEPRWHQNWYQSKAPHNFLLVFHCNYLPGDLMIYWSKISHFCHFNLLQSHLKHSQGAGVLMGCGSWYQKAESLGYPLVKTAWSYGYLFWLNISREQTDSRHLWICCTPAAYSAAAAYEKKKIAE